MSHFYVQVLVAAELSKADMEKEVQRLLAPFDEGADVPEYETVCWCVGRLAKHEAQSAAEAQLGTVDSFRASFRKAHPLPEGKHEFATSALEALTAEEDDALEVAWRAHLAPLLAAEAQAFAAHPLREAAAPDCDECNGQGKHLDTRNPNAHWDWWCIGGRWAGRTGGKTESDTAPVDALLADTGLQRVPYALVTPDGEWHQRGRMGWWGMSSGDMPRRQWAAQVRALLAKWPTHVAVGVDCHI